MTNSVYSETLPQSEINVTGQIRVSKGELIPEGGLNVVLLRLVLNAEGKVTPLGPQGRVKTDNKGNFEFLGVEPDYRSAYQLGTRLDGKLYSTKIFFFKLGEKQIVKDIFIPGITKDIEKLEISQMTLVIESGLSSVTVTEVLTFFNSSSERIDTRERKLEHIIPKDTYNFSMIQSSSGPKIGHHIDDRLLSISNVFSPGNTQIIFHYNLEALFGSLNIQREINHSLEKVSVFTPSGGLQIKSKQLIFSGKQKMDDTYFLEWKGRNSDSNQLKLKIIDVPTDSMEYIGIVGIIILLLFISVIIFYRNKLMMKDSI